MAYNEQHAELMRNSVASFGEVTEKKMFGGLCFLLNGNMLCGVHQGGGMARVGKKLEATALELDGVAPSSFTGRKMGGIVELNDAALEDDQTREAVLSLALEFVGELPAK